MSHSHTCHIDHCCDRHNMHTLVGIFLYWRVKLTVAFVIGIASAADAYGFWTMPIPKRVFIHALIWLVAAEFIARIARAAYDGWLQNRLSGAANVALYAFFEGLILYVAYVLVIGMVTVMVNAMPPETAVRAALEGAQTFFICTIGATQLVMGLAHLFGSRDEAKAWLRGLKRNWALVKEAADEMPEESNAKS